MKMMNMTKILFYFFKDITPTNLHSEFDQYNYIFGHVQMLIFVVQNFSVMLTKFWSYSFGHINSVM